MKPFDLEAAKRGEPIVTRDGREAHFIAYVPELRASHQLITWVGSGVLHNHVNGLYYSDGGESSGDLFMASRKRTVWVNLYEGHRRSAVYHDTEEGADSAATLGRIGGKAFRLEIEE